MVGKGGRRGRRLSLTRTLALFPLFRRRFLGRDRATQTKDSDAVSVNKAPAFKNSKSGLRCATNEPMFKSLPTNQNQAFNGILVTVNKYLKIII